MISIKSLYLKYYLEHSTKKHSKFSIQFLHSDYIINFFNFFFFYEKNFLVQEFFNSQ